MTIFTDPETNEKIATTREEYINMLFGKPKPSVKPESELWQISRKIDDVSDKIFGKLFSKYELHLDDSEFGQLKVELEKLAQAIRKNSKQYEEAKMKEHEVDTAYGAPILPMDTLVEQVWDWFEEKKLSDPVMQMVKVQEEIGELAHEITRANYYGKETVDALGDSFVTLIGMCHHLGIPPEAALSLAYNEIKDRKGKVIDGSFVKE